MATDPEYDITGVYVALAAGSNKVMKNDPRSKGSVYALVRPTVSPPADTEVGWLVEPGSEYSARMGAAESLFARRATNDGASGTHKVMVDAA